MRTVFGLLVSLAFQYAGNARNCILFVVVAVVRFCFFLFRFFPAAEPRQKSGATVALRLHNSTRTTAADELSKLTTSLVFSPVSPALSRCCSGELKEKPEWWVEVRGLRFSSLTFLPSLLLIWLSVCSRNKKILFLGLRLCPSQHLYQHLYIFFLFSVSPVH